MRHRDIGYGHVERDDEIAETENEGGQPQLRRGQPVTNVTNVRYACHCPALIDP